MTKLVCESLEEYKIITEAEGDESGPLKGITHAVKTAPGRVLRKVRAKNVMDKYKLKLVKRINAIVPKYQPNIKNLVNKTDQRIKLIKAETDEERKNQMKDILDDLEQSMKQILETIKNSMQEQLKVYAESLHNRLERAGTITGVKFYPEEKTNLLSRWKAIEEDINALIQKNLINLINDPSIAKFQQIKAELQHYVDKIRGYHSDFEIEEESQEELIDPNSEDGKALEQIKQQNIMFDHLYIIEDISKFEEPKPTKNNFVAFKINKKDKKIYYAFYIKHPKLNRTIRDKRYEARYIVKKEDKGSEWQNRLEQMELGIKKD